MNTGLVMGVKVVLPILVTLYWYVLFQLIDAILERPRLNLWMRTVVSAINAAILFLCMQEVPNAVLSYIVTIVLIVVELVLFYRDGFVRAWFCASACVMHVLAIGITSICVLSLFTGHSIAEISHGSEYLIFAMVAQFALLIVAILLVLRMVPLDYVRIINAHREQQWFMILWMSISNAYLLLNIGIFEWSSGARLQPINEMIASFFVLTGLYIVLLFSIKSCTLLGYKEKNAALEQAVVLEQQYRNSITKDAVSYYEINITKDKILTGFEGEGMELGEMARRYSDMLSFMVRKLVYSEDIPEFMRYASIQNIMREFELGKSETMAEYRRLVEGGAYKWVRAITNIVAEAASGDLLAFVCIKDIHAEKERQLELEYKAERDPLTGLYNKEITGKLINEHLLMDRNHVGSALFMIDVDNFKTINDSLSHIYGDAVLCELGDKLQKIFRSDDIVGRIGGDEYMAYLKNCKSTLKIEEKAQEICEAFHIIYEGGENEKHPISASVGISMSPQDGSTFSELYKCADAALYQAKNRGKNNYSIYKGEAFAGYKANRTEIEAKDATSLKQFRHNKIEYVFKILYQSENGDMAIKAVLELVASHFSFERGYIFETSSDGKTTSNTFEWCASGVSPEIEHLQNLPIEAVATAHAHFYKNGIFILKNLDEIKATERAVLEPQGIKSMFQFGIFDKSQLLGFIGFDNCRSQTLPDEGDIDEIATICNILSTFFVKQHLDQATANGLLLFQDVMNHLESYIYVINRQTFKVLFMNEKTRNIILESELEEPCYRFFRGNDSPCMDCPVRELTDDTKRCVKEIYNEKLHIWTESTASILRWRDGSVASLVNCTDITRQKTEQLQHITQLNSIAYVDALTGGLSYQKFKKDAQRILDCQKDLPHFIVKMDVDNFKLVNQLYGYEKGDDVLRNMAMAISQTVRDDDEIFARVVNDEFVILFTLRESLDMQNLYYKFVQNFQHLMSQDSPIRCQFLHGHYVLYPGDVEKPDIMDMLEKVNLAHKVAKQSTSREFVVYDESMIKQALHKKEMEDRMEDALANNEFQVYLQPKYWLEDESIGGAEALVRWKTNQKDFFYPDAFIPIFERNGFITKLDFFMLDKVCGILVDWIAQGITPIVVSVNFSRVHLQNPSFVQDLSKTVDRHGLNHKYIEIEITETVMYENIKTLEGLLKELHKDGFSMSMDDFGSGYSSLGMLKNLPVDVIKMDRSFFVDQTDELRSQVVMRSVIEMAAALDIRVVAEGIEKRESLELLRVLHCDMGQGYLFAKPMPVEEFTQLLLTAKKKQEVQ